MPILFAQRNKMGYNRKHVDNNGGLMIPDKRRGKILELIQNNPSISNAAISDSLSVPSETIRTDLIVLEQEGLIKRHHGHCEIVKPEAVTKRLMLSGSLSKEERRDEIVRMLADKREIKVRSLSQAFRVSEATIRNDLADLEERGVVRRSYGSAEFVKDDSGSIVLSLIANTESCPKAEHVGSRMLDWIEDGDVVFLDGSPGSLFCALHIQQDLGITVLTNSLKAGMIFARRNCSFNVYLLPGSIINERCVTDLRFHDPVIDHFVISKAFISATSFDMRRGFLFDDHDKFDTFNSIIPRTEHAYVLLCSDTLDDHATYGTPLSRVGEALTEILVDDGLSEENASAFFPSDIPVAICGDNYVATSPFNKRYVIGFSSLYGSHEFSQIVRQGIENAARKRPGIELILTDNKMDADITIKNIEMFIQKEVDLVIEYQHEYNLGPLIVEKLSDAGIPIIAIDIPIPGAVYFGANNYRAGLVAGEKAVEAVKNKWDESVDVVVTLSNSVTGPISDNRIAGMLEKVSNDLSFPDDKVINVNTENETPVAERDFEAALDSIPPGRRMLILAFNDVVCIGALNALRKRGREEDAVAVSHSYIRSISKEMRRKKTPLVGSVAFFPEKYGERILDLAIRILHKKPVSPANYTDHQWVTT